MTIVDAPPHAGRREWIALAILCLPTLLTTADISILFLALPHVSADLGPGATQQLWLTDIYGFMIAGFLITMGTLGDRIGHRTVLLAGAAGFIAASLLGAYSTSTTMLLIARALMGVAAATVMPSVLALIRVMFPDPKQMGAAFGAWGSSIMLGVVLGPVIGGLLLNSFWWGSVFLIGIPVMALVLAVGPALLPKYSNPQAGKQDLLSLILSLAALLPFIYGLKELARKGWDAVPLVTIAVGLVFAVLFLVRQRGMTDPMLDLALFRIRAISGVIVFGLAVGFMLGGNGLMIALYLQVVEGFTPLQVGLWLLVPAIGLMIGSNAGPAIARSVRPAYVMAGGVAVSAIGSLLLTQVDRASGIALLLIGMGVTFLGTSLGGTLGQLPDDVLRAPGEGRSSRFAPVHRWRVRYRAGRRPPGQRRHRHLPRRCDRSGRGSGRPGRCSRREHRGRKRRCAHASWSGGHPPTRLRTGRIHPSAARDRWGQRGALHLLGRLRRGQAQARSGAEWWDVHAARVARRLRPRRGRPGETRPDRHIRVGRSHRVTRRRKVLKIGCRD